MTRFSFIRRAAIALAALAGAAGLAPPASAADVTVDTLAPRAERTFEMPIGAWQTRTVTLYGAGMSDIDLFVDDANGTRVCSSVGLSDAEFCEVTALGVGQIARVTVRNLGYASNNFMLLID